MKKITAALSLLLVIGCHEEPSGSFRVEWQKLGLDGRIVNEMELDGANLYVATTTGFFKRAATSSTFETVGFEGKNVEAIEVLGDGELLVSIVDKTGAEQPRLLKSVDDGATWNEVASNFGGQMHEPMFDLTVHPDDKNILYATGYAVVASSSDQGVSWQPIYGDWGGIATGMSVIEINPLNTELWAGGQGAIENGILLHSTDGENWQSWGDLVENPTVVKEITFSTNDERELFVGFEGALLKTVDNGATWQTLVRSEENRFFFGICLDPGDSKRVYAGGWLKTSDEQPLILFISKDGGTTWNETKLNSEPYGGILEMQIKTGDDHDEIFLGLDKGGVYRATIFD